MQLCAISECRRSWPSSRRVGTAACASRSCRVCTRTATTAGRPPAARAAPTTHPLPPPLLVSPPPAPAPPTLKLLARLAVASRRSSSARSRRAAWCAYRSSRRARCSARCPASTSSTRAASTNGCGCVSFATIMSVHGDCSSLVLSARVLCALACPLISATDVQFSHKA